MSSSNETRARLLIVPHFANNHIRGAAALARASYDLELQLDKGLDGFPFWEHKGNVVGCLLMTVAFLEATINELIFSANVNVNKWDPRKGARELSGIREIRTN